MKIIRTTAAVFAAGTITLSIVSAAAPASASASTVASSASMVAYAAPASASASTVAYAVPVGGLGGLHSNFVHAKVRPSGKLIWTGDGSAWFSHMRWTSWSRYSARGSATVHVRSCFGSCFKYKTEHTTLHFYRVRRHDGQRYFTRLHFHLRHKDAGLGSGTLHFFHIGLPAWFNA